MISEHIQQLLNKQMQMEFYSAYLYLDMQTWFQQKSLHGFAHWYGVQVKEERDHALRLHSYLLRTGGTPEFREIPAPGGGFTGVGDILHRTLGHEQNVTASVNELMTNAQEAHDYNTIQFLQWFITEQCEEEDTVKGLIARFDIAQQSEAGILFMDSELSTRIYTPPQDAAGTANA